MKIAMIASNYISVPPNYRKLPPGWIGAIETVVYNLTNALVDRGHDVTLFASGDSKTKAKLVSVIKHPYDYYKKDGTINKEALIDEDLFLIYRACEMAKKGEFDIIHSHHYSRTLFFSPLIATPMVETLHSPSSAATDRFVKYFGKNIHFICISDNQKASLPSVDFARTVYHGLDISRFKYNGKSDDYFAFTGRIVPEKGLHIAISIAKKCGLNLKIAGPLPASQQEYFNKKIKPYLCEKIEYLGVLELSKLRKMVGRAVAVLMPIQWSEPFGLVIIEAMALGTPVIAFAKGSVPELIVHGKTGFVVNTEKEMIKAIGKIGALRRIDCRTHVENNFSIAKMAENYENVYKEIIQKSKLKKP